MQLAFTLCLPCSFRGSSAHVTEILPTQKSVLVIFFMNTGSDFP
jgi:hypothetical protein